MAKLLKYILGLIGIVAFVFIIGLLMRSKPSEKVPAVVVSEESEEKFEGIGLLGYKVTDTLNGFSFLVKYSAKTIPPINKPLPLNVSDRCIKTNPDIRGKWRWLDYNILFFVPDSDAVLPDRVVFGFRCIPLDSTHYLDANSEEHKWTFLPVGHVKVEYLRKDIAKLSLYLRLPVKDTTRAREFIVVKDQTPREKYWEEPDRFIIVLDINGDTIVPVKIKLKRGLEFKGNIKIRRDYVRSVKVGKVLGDLGVRYVRFHKSGDGGYLECGFIANGGQHVTLTQDAKDYITFSPGIEFTTGVMGSRLYIYGDFEGGKRYTLNIKSGLRSKEGYVLQKDFKRSFDVPVPDAKLKFLSRGLYMGKAASLKVPFSIRRIKKLYLSVEWMPPEHIPFYYFAGNASSGRFYQFGREIISDKEIPLKNEGYREKVEFLDLSQYLEQDRKGLYKITLRGEVKDDKYQSYVTTQMVVAITDLAIVSKYSDSMLNVWVFDVNNLTPVSGAKIKALSYNGFSLGEGTTNSDGMCVLKINGDLSPYIVTARKLDKWSFVNLDETSLDLSYFDISGKDARKPYSAMLYFQRDLYRPGDTIFYNVIVRESGTYSGVSLPIKLKIKDPRGKLLADLDGMTDDAGYFGGSYPTQIVSPTGRYVFELYVGGELYASRSVNVETFVPERIALKVNVPSQVYSNVFKVNLSAMYLFGTPCANSPYTLRVYGMPARYVSKHYPQYEFGLPVRQKYIREINVLDGNLDKSGKVDIKVDVGDYLKKEKSNPFKVDLIASVREEESGRSTEKKRSLMVYGAPYYIGLRSNKKSYKRGEKVNIDGVIVTPYDTLARSVGYVKVILYRLEYYYSYWYDDDDYDDYETSALKWDRYTTMLPVREEDSVPVRDGKFSYSFAYPSSWEDYVIEVDAPTGIKARKLLQSDWWWWGENAGKKPQPPEVLDIALSKDTADENEYVTARVKLPFDGWILWSVELDTIYQSQWLKAEGKVAEWSFQVPGGVPDVYVSCLLVRNNGNYMLKRGIGIKRLKILPKRLLLDVDLRAPDEVRPGKNIDIVLKAKEDFEATVSVVDEGILSITNFKTPDPLAGILENLRLLFRTSETFGWFRPQYLQTGGGFRGRKESIQPKFFTTVTYFSGLRKSKHGKIELKVPVGNYQGKVRIMVDAFNYSKMAKVEKDVIVKSDVVVYVTMPRFLCVEDTFYLPVTMMNTVDRDITVNLKIKPQGLVVENGEREVKLNAKGKKSLKFKCYVEKFSKSARVDIYATYPNGEFKDTFIIPIHPDKPYVTISKSFKVTPQNGIVYLDSMISGYLKTQHHVGIFATSNIYLRGLYAARGVIGYPYGCVEQTSSKLYMLIALSPFMGLFKDIVSPERLDYYISAGIERLMSMQTWDGGFSFWPGGVTSDRGYSGYATLVLEMAKERGYYVPDGVLDMAYDYLESNGKDLALSLYALARGGRLNKIPGGVEAAIKIYKKSRYVPDRLWAILAIYESGKAKLARMFFRELIKTDKVFKKYWLPVYYIYRESLFDKGLKLYVGERIGFDKNVVDSLAKEVNLALIQKEFYYHSTQALVWSLLGLAEYSERLSSGPLKVVLHANGRTYKPQKAGSMLYFYLEEPDPKNVYLKGSNDKYFVIVQNTGFKIGGRFEKEAEGLNISRELFTYSGIPLADSLIKPGDLVIMKVSWRSDEWAKNVAIEVPIPAGMEIENPKLSKEALPAWTKRFKDIAKPDYVDIRDDRIVIFGETSRWITNYFVLLRVNLKGNYFLSPARGVLMYRPEIYYNGKSERVVIP